MRKILSSVLLISFTSTTFAQENLFANLDYPGLQVSPRATERLAQLAEMEEERTAAGMDHDHFWSHDIVRRRETKG